MTKYSLNVHRSVESLVIFIVSSNHQRGEQFAASLLRANSCVALFLDHRSKNSPRKDDHGLSNCVIFRTVIGMSDVGLSILFLRQANSIHQVFIAWI